MFDQPFNLFYDGEFVEGFKTYNAALNEYFKSIDNDNENVDHEYQILEVRKQADD